MKVMKRIVCLSLVCLMMVAMLAGCKAKLIGEWEAEESGVTITVLKLDKDGTGEFLGAEIEWKTKGKFLVITVNDETEEIEYKVKGDTLTLINDDGEEMELTKK